MLTWLRRNSRCSFLWIRHRPTGWHHHQGQRHHNLLVGNCQPRWRHCHHDRPRQLMLFLLMSRCNISTTICGSRPRWWNIRFLDFDRCCLPAVFEPSLAGSWRWLCSAPVEVGDDDGEDMADDHNEDGKYEMIIFTCWSCSLLIFSIWNKKILLLQVGLETISSSWW